MSVQAILLISAGIFLGMSFVSAVSAIKDIRDALSILAHEAGRLADHHERFPAPDTIVGTVTPEDAALLRKLAGMPPVDTGDNGATGSVGPL